MKQARTRRKSARRQFHGRLRWRRGPSHARSTGGLINGDVDSYGHGRMFAVQTVLSRDLFPTGHRWERDTREFMNYIDSDSASVGATMYRDTNREREKVFFLREKKIN